MRLEVRARTGKLNRSLEEQVERRLRYALARFSDRVSRVTAYLADQNGPRGGVDQHCRITVHLLPRGKIMAEATHVDMLAAVSRAADRIVRRVRDMLDRKRTMRMRGIAPLPEGTAT
jgi:ribosome-associated translation inhibitor RaiA